VRANWLRLVAWEMEKVYGAEQVGCIVLYTFPCDGSEIDKQMTSYDNSGHTQVSPDSWVLENKH